MNLCYMQKVKVSQISGTSKLQVIFSFSLFYIYDAIPGEILI